MLLNFNNHWCSFYMLNFNKHCICFLVVHFNQKVDDSPPKSCEKEYNLDLKRKRTPFTTQSIMLWHGFWSQKDPFIIKYVTCLTVLSLFRYWGCRFGFRVGIEVVVHVVLGFRVVGLVVIVVRGVVSTITSSKFKQNLLEWFTKYLISSTL